jgi:hypothetical protein
MKLGNWFAVAGSLGLFAAVAASAPGCTVTSSDNLDGGFFGGDGSSEQDSGLADFSVCANCLNPYCAGNFSVCTTNGDCISILRCALQCTTTACVGACIQAHPNGESAYRSYATCDTVNECGACAAQCPTQKAAQTCPEVPDAAPPPVDDSGSPVDAGPSTVDSGTVGQVDACVQCQKDSCSAQYQACASPTSDCGKFNACQLTCSDQASCDACNTNTAGKDAATALGTCTTTQCKSVCTFQ